MSVFVLDSKTKEGDKIVLQRVCFEISDKGSYSNQENWLKYDKASEEPIETTAESSFSELFRSSKPTSERRSHERSRGILKSDKGLFLKSIAAGEKLQETTPGSGMLSILPGKCRTFRKCIG